MNGKKMKASLKAALGVLCALWLLGGCDPSPDGKTPFVAIGEFSVRSMDNGVKELRDGAGRKLLLIPRGQEAPEGYEKHRIVPVPVQRVVAYSGYDTGMLKVLGVVEDVLVGVTKERERWFVPEVANAMDRGKVHHIGNPGAVDFERLNALRPELVFTWDQSVLPMLEELGIPCVITSGTEAMNLDTRIRYARFMAQFFDREKEADAFAGRVRKALTRIRNITRHVPEKPSVMWGDIYEKRVRVEPGNSWVAQMVEMAGGKYLFDDVAGAS